MGTSGETGERRVNNGLTQGDQEGGAPQGASPAGSRTLFCKRRADNSTFKASEALHQPVPTWLATYPSPEAARQDRDFAGGLFWVGPNDMAPGLRGLRATHVIVDEIGTGRTLRVPGPSPIRFTDTNQPAEQVKDHNPKTVYGEAKPSLSLIPGPALVEIAQAMREGKAKYGSMNWRDDPVSSTTYADAALRHLFQWLDGEDRCPKSGALHLAHLAANAMILIDAALQGTLIDDRPPAGTTSAAIDRNTRPIKGADTKEAQDGR